MVLPTGRRNVFAAIFASGALPFAAAIGRLRSCTVGASSRALCSGGAASQNGDRPRVRVVAAARYWRAAPKPALVEEEVSTPEAAKYWRKAMAGIDRPDLRSLIGSMDWKHPLGVSRKRGAGKVQCYETFLEAKKKHPLCVVLVRIGDFYESIGFDAMVLIHHTGCNPMSPESGVAQAGFQKAPNTLRRQLNRLLTAGFSVAMVEEVGVLASSRGTPGKLRQLVGVVSASSPYYLHGDVEDLYEGDDTPPPRPITGVSISGGGGYRLLRYCAARRAVLVQSQLSQEALLSQLHATGLAPPLLLHASVGVRDSQLPRGSRLAPRLAAMLSVRVEPYGSAADDAAARARGGRRGLGGGDVEGFRRLVGQRLGLDTGEMERMQVLSPPLHGDTPIPPALSTVSQLGLANTLGVPPLLAALLPPRCPTPARDWVRLVLLLPPPPTVAEDIRCACAALADPGPGAAPLPPLETGLGGSRMLVLLAAQAAGHNTLREVQGMLERCVELLRVTGPAATLLHCSLVGVLQWSLQVHVGLSWDQVPPGQLADACEAAAGAIRAVLPPLQAGGGLAEAFTVKALEAERGDGDGDSSASEGDEDVEEGDERGGGGKVADRATLPPGGWLPPGQLAAVCPGGLAALRPLERAALLAAEGLARRTERWRLSVREECVREVADKVSEKRLKLLRALMELAGGLEAAGVRADMVLPPRDRAVWVQPRNVKKGQVTPAETAAFAAAVKSASGLALVHPRNRKRGEERHRFTTEQLQAAAVEYAQAVDAAEHKSREWLRDLCRRLYGGSGDSGSAALPTLLAAHQLSVIVTALEQHVTQAKRAGWNWPLMPGVHTLSRPGGEAGRAVRLVLPGLWPYWMERRGAVANDIVLRAGATALLTGPNMAGKSTVLRSVAAASLLSICGFSVPADAGCAPALPPGDPGPSMAELEALAPLPAPASGPATAAAGSAAGAGAGPASAAPLALSASWLTHVSLRNFSGDSPLEGKSAFAVEMEDTASTLSVAASAGRGCLVLMDELGKGTEVVAGSALAGAVLDELVAAGTAGVFATHLHDLVWLAQEHMAAGRMQHWAMEVGREPQLGQPGLPPGSAGALRPTWRVLAGQYCLASMARQVAADCGMPARALRAAAAYEERLRELVRAAREAEYAGGGAGAHGADDGDMDGGVGAMCAVPASEWLWVRAPEVEQLPARAGPLYASQQEHAMAAASAAEAVGAEADIATPVPQRAEQEAALQDAEIDGEDEEVAWEAETSGTDIGSDDDAPTEAGSDAALSAAEAPAVDPWTAPAAAACVRRELTLRDAAGLLQQHVQAAIARTTGHTAPRPEVPVYTLPAGWRVPSGHLGEAAVYVLRCWDGTFYVGESEDVATRITRHRAMETRERRAADKPLFQATRRATSLEAVYCVVPRASGGGKSGALDVESDLIAALQRAGFHMRSTHDKARSKRHLPRLAAAPLVVLRGAEVGEEEAGQEAGAAAAHGWQPGSGRGDDAGAATKPQP